MRGRRSIFGKRVCAFHGRRSVSLICKRCKTKVNPLRRSCVSKRSRCGAVRTCCGDCACRSALAVAPCECVLSSANPRANVSRARRTLCGDRACRSALAVAPRECVLSSANPLRRLCVSKRSRCGAVRMCLELGEPSAKIVRVEALSLWRRANVSRAQRTLCGDRACRSVLAVAPRECVLSSANPLRRLCVSKRSRCGAVRMCLELGELSAKIVRVEALSLCRRANVSRARRTLCGDRACRSALAVAPCKVRRALPHLRLRRQRLRTKLARKVRSRICGPKFATSRCKK